MYGAYRSLRRGTLQILRRSKPLPVHDADYSTAANCASASAKHSYLISQSQDQMDGMTQAANISARSDASAVPVRVHVPNNVKHPQLLIAIVDGPLQAVAILRSFCHGTPTASGPAACSFLQMTAVLLPLIEWPAAIYGLCASVLHTRQAKGDSGRPSKSMRKLSHIPFHRIA